MNTLLRAWRVYVVPAAVFQSLMVGGGYGTGREIIEYFSRFGIAGGYFGLALAGLCFAVLSSISYEFARVYRAYDYARFSASFSVDFALDLKSSISSCSRSCWP